MKRGKNLLLLFIIVISLAAVLSACSFFIQPIYSITVAEESKTLTVGEEYSINYTVSPASYSGSVLFDSSDVEVCTVSDSGVVYAKAVGESTITISSNSSNAKAEVVITVSYAPIEKLIISQNAAETNQIYLEGQELASDVNFYINGLTKSDPQEIAAIEWVITEQKTGTEVDTGYGESYTFKYTSFDQLGITYVVTVSYSYNGIPITPASVNFGWYRKTSAISISAETTYEMGKTMSITALLDPESASPNNIEWYCSINSPIFERIEGNTKTLSYIPKKYGTYTLKCKQLQPDNTYVESNSVSFDSEYAEVDDVEISVQRNRVAKGSTLPIVAKWNKEYNDPLTIYVYVWTVNGTIQAGENEPTFNFMRSVGGSYNIGLSVNGVAAQSLVITVDEEYAAITNIFISADNNGVLTPTNGYYPTVTYTANAYPFSGTDPYAEFEWYVNDELQSQTGKTFSFTPTTVKVAEYHVVAKIGYVESAINTTVTKKASFDDRDVYLGGSGYTHTYGGYVQNFYITTQNEMNNIIGYARENRRTSMGIYIDYGANIPTIANNTASKVGLSFSAYAESGTTPSVSTASNVNTGYVLLTFDYTDASATSSSKTTALAAYSQSSLNAPIVSATGRAEGATLYIDTVENTMHAFSSNALYKIVSWGYKPTFSSTSESLAAKRVYEAARDVLESIIDDGMTDMEKVRAIYGWICYNVKYDYYLAELDTASINESMKYDGYYLEGVFDNSKAVCDGKSKAFTLLCGMEGIKSVRVTGTATSGVTTGGHAWNKVLLDADENGTAEWYVVDTTWGDVPFKGSQELMTYKYFLLSDAEISSTHTEKENGGEIPAAINEYNYYLNATVTLGGIEWSLYVGSYNEARRIREYAEQAGLDGIEIYCTNSNFITAMNGAHRQAYDMSDGVYIMEL